MMRKAKKIIKTKLEKFPLNFLLQDEDFIDSVFFRFAIMDLPLRPGNVHHITLRQITLKMINIRRGFRSVQGLPGEQGPPHQHQASIETSRVLAGGCDHQAGEECGEETVNKYQQNPQGASKASENCFIKYLWSFYQRNYLVYMTLILRSICLWNHFTFQFTKFKFLDIKSQFHVQINSIYIPVNLNTI